MTNPNIAFSYHGGKNKLVRRLIPYLPKTPAYCEPFCGGASVFLNREPSGYNLLNDADDRIINFFQVLRDHPEDLIRRIRLTPFAQTEFQRCRPQDADCPIERARQTFVVLSQALFASTTASTWKLCRTGLASPPKQNKLADRLEAIASRLQEACFCNRDAVELVTWIIEQPVNWLIYADPPYFTGRSDLYRESMTLAQHEALLEVLRRAECPVAISGYASELYDGALSDWRRVEFSVVDGGGARASASTSNSYSAVEVLWMNYDPPNEGGLF